MKITLSAEEVKNIVCCWLLENNHAQKEDIQELKMVVDVKNETLDFELIFK
jgi:hypothetical protein